MTDEADSARSSPPPIGPEPAYRELETVLVGLWPAVLAVQAALAARGLETFIPDEMVKTIDPFITGGNPFVVRLQAPAESAVATARAIQELRHGPRPPAESPAPSVEGESPRGAEAVPEEEEEESDPEPDPALAEVEALGARVRWASLVPLLSPFGIFQGVDFRTFSERGRPRPLTGKARPAKGSGSMEMRTRARTAPARPSYGGAIYRRRVPGTP